MTTHLTRSASARQTGPRLAQRYIARPERTTDYESFTEFALERSSSFRRLTQTGPPKHAADDKGRRSAPTTTLRNRQRSVLDAKLSDANHSPADIPAAISFSVSLRPFPDVPAVHQFAELEHVDYLKSIKLR
jgi:hypothetical protein